MTANPAQTRIINGMLADLGSTTRLQSIDDRGNVAADVRALWDDMVRNLLDQHTWNFAIQRTSVPLAEILPEGMGFTYAYDLPADCLRWLPPRRDDGMASYEAECEGGRLLTNAEAPLPVRYISATLGTRVSSWPPHFAKLARCELSALMADGLTQSETIAQRKREEADGELRRAKRRDGVQSGRTSRSNVITGSDWLTARDRPYQFSGR